MTDPERQVRAASRNFAKAWAEFQMSVLEARKAGTTWTAIGKILGVTRQSAWQRFHHLEEDQ